MFGERFIYFGVLHCAGGQCWDGVCSSCLAFLALGPGGAALFTGRAGSRLCRHGTALAQLARAGGGQTRHRGLWPLLPWFGVVLWGMVAGAWLAARGGAGIRPSSLPGRLLVWLGRHSLLIYLMHQPLLMAGFWLSLN